MAWATRSGKPGVLQSSVGANGFLPMFLRHIGLDEPSSFAIPHGWQSPPWNQRSHQPNTARVFQSITATKYAKPCRIGM